MKELADDDIMHSLLVLNLALVETFDTTISVYWYKFNQSQVFKHVMKTGGDNCTLTSNEMDLKLKNF